MRILGISTPAKYLSICISDVEGDEPPFKSDIIAEFSSLGSKSEDLTALANQTFAAAKTDITSVELICAVTGPGSYSGLRGGLAAAKSFAQVLGIPIVGVSALEAMAGELSRVEGTVAAVLDAVKDEYNFALFSVSGGKVSRLSQDTVMTKTKLGEFFGGFKGTLYAASPFDDLKGISDNANVKNIKAFARASHACNAGFATYLSGKTDDYLKIVPDYSHAPKLKEYQR